MQNRARLFKTTPTIDWQQIFSSTTNFNICWFDMESSRVTFRGARNHALRCTRSAVVAYPIQLFFTQIPHVARTDGKFDSR
jgi:hypothetical protein